MLTSIIITLIVIICGLLQARFILIITTVLPLQIRYSEQSFATLLHYFFRMPILQWSEPFHFDFYNELEMNISHQRQRCLPRWWVIYSVSLFLQLLGLHYYGFSFEWGVWISISSLLVMLMIIDWNYLLLPDCLTFTLLWLGLLFPLSHRDISVESQVWGAVVGYLSLRGLNMLYHFFYQREGLGLGDCKLLAVLGVLLGLAALPYLLIVACVLGGGIIFGRYLKADQTLMAPIPFGSCLSLAAMGLCSPFSPYQLA